MSSIIEQHRILGPHEVDGVVRPKISSSDKKNKKDKKHSEKVKQDEENNTVKEDEEKKDKKNKKNKKKRDADDVAEEESNGNGKKSKKDDNNDEEEEELGMELSEENALTLEARLELLSKQMSKLEEESNNNHNNTDNELQLPSAQSLVTLLEQALQSGDEGLLEQCLSCSNQQMIQLTTQELTTSKVMVFLKKLIAKFEKRPTRGQLITVWLANVLKYHISYLITVPDLTKQLAALSVIIEHRLSNHSKLVALAGRLDLLMAQITANHSKTSHNSNIEPAIIYEEND